LAMAQASELTCFCTRAFRGCCPAALSFDMARLHLLTKRASLARVNRHSRRCCRECRARPKAPWTRAQASAPSRPASGNRSKTRTGRRPLPAVAGSHASSSYVRRTRRDGSESSPTTWPSDWWAARIPA
jgi:hypothetical protein